VGSALSAFVLVVDGEMPLADLQARLNSILLGLGIDVPNHRLRILAADNSGGRAVRGWRRYP
jgi:hypothetical protein